VQVVVRDELRNDLIRRRIFKSAKCYSHFVELLSRLPKRFGVQIRGVTGVTQLGSRLNNTRMRAILSLRLARSRSELIRSRSSSLNGGAATCSRLMAWAVFVLQFLIVFLIDPPHIQADALIALLIGSSIALQ
jgi:hypothetical protein